MNKERYYKIMFLVAAAWNLIVGLLIILSSIIMLDEIAGLMGLSPPPSLFFIHSLFFLVIIFGIGLLLVAINPVENYSIIKVVILEKFTMFMVALVYLLIGDINFMAFSIPIVDLVFGILFLEFLINYEK